jgi:hypothetical protein
VPLNRAFIRSCPLLLEGDLLSLSPYLVQEGIRLRDTIVNATHTLAEPGDRFVSLLGRTTTYRQLARAAKQSRVEATTLQELLGFLNKIGALQIQRSWHGKIVATRIRCLHLLLGITYPALCRRRETTAFWVSICALRATTPVILATGVVATLSGVAGLGSPLTILLTASYWLSLFIGSVIIHELAHVLVLRRCVATNVLQANMRLGIIHAQPAPAIEAASSLAGPLAGIVLCVLAFSLTRWVDMALLGPTSAVIAVCHAISLLPFYGDGMSLQRALHERKRTHETHP